MASCQSIRREVSLTPHLLKQVSWAAKVKGLRIHSPPHEAMAEVYMFNSFTVESRTEPKFNLSSPLLALIAAIPFFPLLTLLSTWMCISSTVIWFLISELFPNVSGCKFYFLEISLVPNTIPFTQRSFSKWCSLPAFF